MGSTTLKIRLAFSCEGMLAVAALFGESLLLPTARAGASVNSVQRTPQPQAVFGLFKESEEAKRRKEEEWKAIQEKQRLRQDPAAAEKYEQEVQTRRLEE